MATNTEISKLFITLFNRATDKNVLDTFTNQTVNPTLIRELIAGKYDEALGINSRGIEAQANKAFIESLYKNVLGRAPEEDTEGVNYWLALLEGSTTEPKRDPMSKEDLVDAFLAEVQRYEEASKGNGKITLTLLDGTTKEYTLTSTDRDSIKVFNAKIEVSNMAATKVNKADANELTFGKGLSEITAIDTDTAKQNALDDVGNVAIRNPIPVKGNENGELTTQNPNFDANNGATSGDDTIKGLVDPDDSKATLKSNSKIDAGEGNDTLNVEMKGSFDGLGASGSLTNVETINLTNTSGQDLEFNAEGIKGTYTYNIKGNGNTIALNNVAYHKALAISLDNVKGSDTDNKTAIRFASDSVPSNSGLNLNLKDVGTENQTHGIELNENISSIQSKIAGKNYVNFSSEGADNLKSITLGGTGSLTTELGANVNSFDASEVQGNVKVTLASAGTTGNNNEFKQFLTGSGRDDVTLNVARLSNDTNIDLGAGEDTLTLQGSFTNTTTQYYNLSSVENLVLKTDAANTLSLDLGTSKFSNFGESQATDDRSKNLKNVTFESGDVNIKGLGAKSLNVSYDATSGSLALDHAGKTNLNIREQQTAGTGTAGRIDLSNTNNLNISVGETYNGELSAAKATELAINNFTTNKGFTVNAAGDNRINDLTSVSTLKINTESTGGVSLDNAEFKVLSNVNLLGKGNVTLGTLSNSSGISVDGKGFIGDLTLGEVSTSTGAINIVTAGALSTEAIKGSNVTLDLSNSNRANDVKTITLDGNQGTLNYSTGRMGTSGDNNKETQTINISTQRANLTLNGKEGNDKFEINAKDLTKTLAISGDLGTSKNKEDKVTINLSESTSGVKLDTSRLKAENVEITASKGQDKITLGNDSTEYVKFESQPAARAEEYGITVKAGLQANQGVKLGGVTLLAKETVTSTELRDALLEVLKGGAITSAKFTKIGSNINDTNLTGWDLTNARLEGNDKIVVAHNNTGNQPDVDNLFNFTADALEAATAIGSSDIAYSEGNEASTTFSYDTVTVSAVTQNTTAEYKIIGLNGVDELGIKITAVSGADTDVSAENVAKIIAGVVEGSQNGANTSITGLTNVSGIQVKPSSGGSYSDASFSSSTLTLASTDYSKGGIKIVSEAGTIKGEAQDGTTDMPTADVTISGGSISTSANTLVNHTTVAAKKSSYEITFKALKAGQSYELDGKTVTATEGLTADNVAKAFTEDSGSTTVTGASITGEFANIADAGKDWKLDTYSSGTKITIKSAQDGEFTQTFTVNGNKAGTPPTLSDIFEQKVHKQGSNGSDIAPDSLIELEGNGDGTYANPYKFNKDKMDSISNFQLNKDKLDLSKTDSSKFTKANDFLSANTGADVSLDSKNEVKLAGTVNNGVFKFQEDYSGTKYSATLDQKLAFFKDIATDKIVAFEHMNNTYVIAGGNDATKVADNFVLELTGLKGVSDLSDLLLP